MKTYIYTGPDSGITLQDKQTSTDVLLRDGMTVDLPEENAAVRTLVGMKYLTEVPAGAAAVTPAAPAAPAKKTASK